MGKDDSSHQFHSAHLHVLRLNVDSYLFTLCLYFFITYSIANYNSNIKIVNFFVLLDIIGRDRKHSVKTVSPYMKTCCNLQLSVVSCYKGKRFYFTFGKLNYF